MRGGGLTDAGEANGKERKKRGLGFREGRAAKRRVAGHLGDQIFWWANSAAVNGKKGKGKAVERVEGAVGGRCEEGSDG